VRFLLTEIRAYQSLLSALRAGAPSTRPSSEISAERPSQLAAAGLARAEANAVSDWNPCEGSQNGMRRVAMRAGIHSPGFFVERFAHHAVQLFDPLFVADPVRRPLKHHLQTNLRRSMFRLADPPFPFRIAGRARLG